MVWGINQGLGLRAWGVLAPRTFFPAHEPSLHVSSFSLALPSKGRRAPQGLGPEDVTPGELDGCKVAKSVETSAFPKLGSFGA